MDWASAAGRLRAPIFAPLHGVIAHLPSDRWPSHAELTTLAHGIRTARGKTLRFIAPREVPGSPLPENERRYYEVHIDDTGEVETRPESLHDLFNALAWIVYPKAKAQINAQHASILAERGDAEAKRRGPERDSLTLFDEGGVAVASTDHSVFERIRDFEWKRLFWEERESLARTTRFLAFGHALFEQAVEPYLGMVAKTIFIPLVTLPDDASLTRTVDAALAAHFSERSRFASPRQMAPMPLLGVPGWHPQTAQESYYDDRDHFRSKDRRER